MASGVLNELKTLAQEVARAAPEPKLAEQLSAHFPFDVPSVWDYVLLRAQLRERSKALRDRLEDSYKCLPEVRPQNPLIPGDAAGAASALNVGLQPSSIPPPADSHMDSDADSQDSLFSLDTSWEDWELIGS